MNNQYGRIDVFRVSLEDMRRCNEEVGVVYLIKDIYYNPWRQQEFGTMEIHKGRVNNLDIPEVSNRIPTYYVKGLTKDLYRLVNDYEFNRKVRNWVQSSLHNPYEGLKDGSPEADLRRKRSKVSHSIEDHMSIKDYKIIEPMTYQS